MYFMKIRALQKNLWNDEKCKLRMGTSNIKFVFSSHLRLLGVIYFFYFRQYQWRDRIKLSPADELIHHKHMLWFRFAPIAVFDENYSVLEILKSLTLQLSFLFLFGFALIFHFLVCVSSRQSCSTDWLSITFFCTLVLLDNRLYNRFLQIFLLFLNL